MTRCIIHYLPKENLTGPVIVDTSSIINAICLCATLIHGVMPDTVIQIEEQYKLPSGEWVSFEDGPNNGFYDEEGFHRHTSPFV